MDYTIVSQFVDQNLPIIMLVIIVMLIIYTIILITVLVKNRRMKKRYERLMKNADKSSLEDMMLTYQQKINDASKDSILALDQIRLLNNQITHCVQKVGVVRYKAFEDIGSDLSYSIAMLDDKNDGMILTSIFGRNMSTSYAKPVQKGTSKYALSEEEIYAMNKALGLEKK